MADIISNGEDGFSVRTKLNKLFSYWYGKKMVTLGDSITYANLWQSEIVRKLGVTYVDAETTAGTGGHKAMGMSSSRIIPLIDNGYPGQEDGNSIYERADDVDFYSPNLIILLGGQNDAGHPLTLLGVIGDEAYTGDSVVDAEDAPTFYGAYKGTLLKLTTQNPAAKILCVSPFFSNTVGDYALKLPYVNAIIECAKLYGCQSVDLLNDLGINAINFASYLSDGIHPNALGAIRLAALISSRL